MKTTTPLHIGALLIAALSAFGAGTFGVDNAKDLVQGMHEGASISDYVTIVDVFRVGLPLALGVAALTIIAKNWSPIAVLLWGVPVLGVAAIVALVLAPNTVPLPLANAVASHGSSNIFSMLGVFLHFYGVASFLCFVTAGLSVGVWLILVTA
jgi:hypothetical protein